MHYTRKEFAAVCHTTVAVVSTNITQRYKIVEGLDENGNPVVNQKGKKLIDSEHPLNKKFFSEYQKLFEEKQRNPEAFKKGGGPRKKKKTPSIEKPDLSEENTEEASNAYMEALSWDVRKKKADALLKERNAEKALLDVKKMYGEMLPTEFVIYVFSSFSKSIFSYLDNSTMNLAGIFSDELAGGDREALTRVNKRLREELQRIYDDCEVVAKKDLDNSIKEFSKTRRRGQKN